MTKKQIKILRNRDRKNRIVNFIIGTIASIIFLSATYIGFDYAGWKMNQEYEMKMQQQMEWRGKWIEKN